MKIINDYPPNYDRIVEILPAVKDMKNIVFTYGKAIYVPSGEHLLSGDLMVHEECHAERQAASSPEQWWEIYLADPKFRAEEELMAYKRQYKYARRRYSRASFQMLLDRIADDLSGPMYGNIYTKKEAKDLIVGRRK